MRHTLAFLVVIAFVGCDCLEPLGALPAPKAVLVSGVDEAPPLDHLEIALPPTPLQTSAAIALAVRNDGNLDLVVNAVAIGSDPLLCPTPSGAFVVNEPRTFTLGKEGLEQPLNVTFTPTSGAPACAVVELHSDDPVNPILRAVVRGQGDAPQLCTNRAIIDFGEVFVGDSKDDVVQLTSCGTRPITITSSTLNAQFPDPFTADAVATGTPLAPGSVVDIPVHFTPLVEGTWSVAGGTSGTIELTTDAQAGQYRIDLIGTARRPPSCVVQVLPNVVQFGNVGQGRSSTQTVFIRNIGELDCTFTSANVRAPAGSFSRVLVTLTEGQVLTPQASGSLEVTFAPTAIAGVENGILDVASDDPINPLIEVPLEGTSVEVTPCFLEADPTAMNWGFQPLHRTSEKEVTLTNVGSEDCVINDIDLTQGAPEFRVIEPPLTQLGETLPPPFDDLFGSAFGAFVPVGESVTFLVSFRPEQPGPRLGNVHFIYKEMGGGFGGGSDQFLDVPLSGTGTAPCIQVNPLDVDYGNVAVNTNADRDVSIRNCGAVDLYLRGVNLRAGSHPDFDITSSPPLPTVIGPGLDTVVTVRASPTTSGAMFGQLEILTDLDPQFVGLRANTPGACVEGLECSPNPLAFGEVILGETLVRSLVCLNPGTSTVSIAPTVGAPFQIVSAPAAIAPGDAGVVRVRYTPDGTGADSSTVNIGANTCAGAPATIAVNGSGVDNVLPDCPTPTAFTPEVLWEWDGGGAAPNSRQTWSTPLVSRLQDTTGDNVVTRDDMPRVVFISFDQDDAPEYLQTAGIAGSNEQINDPVKGVLRAIDGSTGAEVWTNIEEPAKLNSSVSPAIVDLDGDGCVEIIGQKWILLPGVEDIPGGPKVNGKFARGNLLAFDCTGRVKWESQEWTRTNNELEDAGGIAVGDVDGDGFAEVAVGDHLYDHNGNLLWRGGRGTGSSGHGPTSVLADVDGQPGLELVAGATVYRNDGSILWDHLDDVQFDGHPAVADLDNDGDNEVVMRSAELWVWDGATGAVVAGPLIPPTRMTMGPECENVDDPATEEDDNPCNIIPTNIAIIDVDGNGDLEIAVPAEEIIICYDHDLSEKWRAEIYDGTGASGPAGFDFENDGTVNIVYSDEGSVHSWGPNGSSVYRAPRQSVTMMEYTTIADIDLDGHANLLAGSNEPMFDTAQGLDAWQNSGTRWAHARSIWNQHAYAEELISELGTPVSYTGPLGGFRTASPQCE